MMDRYLTLLVLVLLGGILFLFLLAKKYGFRTVAISVVLSGIIALATFFISFTITFKAMLNHSVDVPNDWHQVTAINNEGQVIALEYRSELGVFAQTETGEVMIAGPIPTCLPDGEVALNLSPDTYAELTQTPRLTIAAPAEKVTQQLFFDIVYPIEADELGVSSYVLDENGEVWCSEIYARGGLGGGAAAGFGAFIFAVIIAIPLFVLAIVVFFISLFVVIFVMRKSENSA